MFENLYETLIEAGKRKKDLLKSAFADFLFLATYGAVSSILLAKIFEHTEKAFGIVQANISSLDEIRSDIFSVLSGIPGFDAEFNTVMFWLLILLVSSYALYVVFESYSWGVIAKRKDLRYAGRFAGLSVIWVAAYFILTFFEGTRGFIYRLTGSEAKSSILFGVSYFLIIFIASVSYSTIGRKKALRKSFALLFRKRVFYTLLEVAAIILLLDIVVRVIWAIDYRAAVFIGIPLVLAAIPFSKLHILRTVEKEK